MVLTVAQLSSAFPGLYMLLRPLVGVWAVNPATDVLKTNIPVIGSTIAPKSFSLGLVTVLR